MSNDGIAAKAPKKLRKMPPPETRSFQKEFFQKHSISTRTIRANHKIDEDQRKPFFQGFVFKTLPNDDKFVPVNYTNEFDLFRQFYEKLIDTAVLNHYIEEVENFFEPAGVRKPGCHLFSTAGIEIGKTHDNPNFDMKVDTKPNINDMALYKVDDTDEATGLYSRRAIHEGEVLLYEKPVIICKSPNCVCSGYEFFECSYCTKSLNIFYSCAQCSVAIYCSEVCREDAYREYHAFECTANKCHFFGKRNSTWVAFRMLTIGALYKFDRKSQNKYSAICATPMRKKVVYLLATLRKAVVIIVYLIKYTKFFDFLTAQECFPDLSLYGKYLRIGGLAIRHIIQADSATQYFPDEIMSFINESKGNSFNTPVLCMQAAFFTHACKPNAAIVYSGNTYFVKAISAIPKGSMITLNFFNIDERFYGMDDKVKCSCLKCTEPKYLYTGNFYICPQCKSGGVMHYPPLFKCQSCGILNVNSELERNIIKLKCMFKTITEMDMESYNSDCLTEYISLHSNVYLQYSPEYLYVLQKGVILLLQNAELQKACDAAYNFLEIVYNVLHKYSLRRLDMLVTIISVVFQLIANKNYFFSSLNLVQLLDLVKAYMNHVSPIASFYLLNAQYIELAKVLLSLEAKLEVQSATDGLLVETCAFNQVVYDFITDDGKANETRVVSYKGTI